MEKDNSARGATPERLGAFSDGVLAIIITIMVLDLKVPHESGPAALWGIWPTFFSYLFVGVVWINHHHLLRHLARVNLAVIWANLSLLFTVSLIPFFTAYMAEKKDSFATALYSGVFLLVTVTFIVFEGVIARQPSLSDSPERGRKRNWVALLAYIVAIPAAYIHPAAALVIIVGISALYFIPDTSKRPNRGR